MIVPATTGQDCIDFVSGHVPQEAEKIYFDTLFSAIVEDIHRLDLLIAVEDIQELQELQGIATKEYTVIRGDDLGGMYERYVEFANGNQVWITFHGRWDCPDFNVTSDEVFKNLGMLQVHIDTEEP